MLNKEIPFFRIVLPLCAGIIAGLWYRPGALFITVSIVFVSAGLLTSLYFKRFHVFYGLAFSSALFLTGLIHYTNEENSLSVLDPSESELTCIVSDYVEERENSMRLEVELKETRKKNHQVALNGSMILYNEKDTTLFSLKPGDILLVRCTPREIVNRGNPGEFDYRSYMQNRGIRYFAFTKGSDIVRKTEPAGRSLVHRSLIVRQKIIDMYRERGITGDTLALVAAITLGQKNMLDPDQKTYFMKAGVMHIMAVSGLHAVILSFFIFKMLFFLGGRLNVLRVIVTLAILWSFAFVTGLTPSVLRATLMFSFLQAGMFMKRPVNSINSVLASAFVLILIRPSVIFDAGFLLSYSAVIFIIIFYKALYDKVEFTGIIPDKLWQMSAVTLVAQAGTLSLTIRLFNQFPVWFILSNIIIVPLSSLLIIIGCLVPLTFPVVFLSKFFATALSWLTGLTETLTREFSLLPISVIQNIGLTQAESILLAVTIYFLLAYILLKESVPVYVPASALVLFLLAGTVKDLINHSAAELIVYNTEGSSSIGIRNGNILTLFTDTVNVNPDITRYCSTRGLKIRTIDNGINPVYIRTEKKKILLCNSLDNIILKRTDPEILILTGNHPEINMSADAHIKKLIFGPEINPAFSFPRQITSGAIDSIHYIRRSGAFRTRL